MDTARGVASLQSRKPGPEMFFPARLKFIKGVFQNFCDKNGTF